MRGWLSHDSILSCNEVSGIPGAVQFDPMRRSRFAEEQIIMALRQAEGGTTVAYFRRCRQGALDYDFS